MFVSREGKTRKSRFEGFSTTYFPTFVLNLKFDFYDFLKEAFQKQKYLEVTIDVPYESKILLNK